MFYLFHLFEINFKDELSVPSSAKGIFFCSLFFRSLFTVSLWGWLWSWLMNVELCECWCGLRHWMFLRNDFSSLFSFKFVSFIVHHETLRAEFWGDESFICLCGDFSSFVETLCTRSKLMNRLTIEANIFYYICWKIDRSKKLFAALKIRVTTVEYFKKLLF